MFDDEVAIFGNGNQDTQSWMHSQETNVMIYQKEIVAELMHSKFRCVTLTGIALLERFNAHQVVRLL
jgi:phosphatidylserine/phosphatidylglycerophosphate/cardiolipin synthase-like enzyme